MKYPIDYFQKIITFASWHGTTDSKSTQRLGQGYLIAVLITLAALYQALKMKKDYMIRVRVDKKTKEAANAIFEKHGINMSTAIRMYLHQILNKAALTKPEKKL
jgi:predicted DNA binding CopG/RHH family protein